MYKKINFKSRKKYFKNFKNKIHSKNNYQVGITIGWKEKLY